MIEIGILHVKIENMVSWLLLYSTSDVTVIVTSVINGSFLQEVFCWLVIAFDVMCLHASLYKA